MKKANDTQKKFRIVGFNQDSEVQSRLVSLGFQLGVELEVWRKDVFGKGVVALIHNQLVGLRKSEFECLKLEPVYDSDTGR